MSKTRKQRKSKISVDLKTKFSNNQRFLVNKETSREFPVSQKSHSDFLGSRKSYKFSRKAQSAFEYLMIIALVLGIIVPTTYLFFKYSTESTVEIIDSQINQIGRNIVETAETVYFSGESSQIILDINMPENVDDIYILVNRELVFKITSEIGETEAVFFSSTSIPITSDDTSADCVDNGNCDLSDIAGFGLKRLKVQAVDDGSGGIEVLISRFTG